MEQLDRMAMREAIMASLSQQAGRMEKAVEHGLRSCFYMEAKIQIRRGKAEPVYQGQNTQRGAALHSARKRALTEEDLAEELVFA